jgi:hypothetical protein
MLIRRLRTWEGPNSDPITTAAVPRPRAVSIGTMCARIAARVNPRRANAMETRIELAREICTAGISGISA